MEKLSIINTQSSNKCW